MAEPGAGGRVLLVDLCGGSCEITLSEHKRMREAISLPLGAVLLTGQFVASDPPPPEGLAQMRQLISHELRRADRRVHPHAVSLVIATSGTAAAPLGCLCGHRSLPWEGAGRSPAAALRAEFLPMNRRMSIARRCCCG